MRSREDYTLVLYRLSAGEGKRTCRPRARLVCLGQGLPASGTACLPRARIPPLRGPVKSLNYFTGVVRLLPSVFCLSPSALRPLPPACRSKAEIPFTGPRHSPQGRSWVNLKSSIEMGLRLMFKAIPILTRSGSTNYAPQGSIESLYQRIIYFFISVPIFQMRNH